MILPDANLILYSYIEEFPNHQKSKEWLEKRSFQRRNYRFVMANHNRICQNRNKSKTF